MSEKGKAILAYIFTWVGGLIVLFGIKDNEKNTKLHAAQAIVIGVAYMIILIIIYIPFFSTIIYGLYIACVIMGIIKANNEQNPEIPVIAGIAKSIFGKKIDE